MFFAGMLLGLIAQAAWAFYVYKLIENGENFRKPSFIVTMVLIQGAVLASTFLYDAIITLGVLVGDILAGIILGLYFRFFTMFKP